MSGHTSLAAHTSAHMSAHTCLGAHTSAHMSAHTIFEANTSAHTSLGAYMSAHPSAFMCAFLPRDPISHCHLTLLYQSLDKKNGLGFTQKGQLMSDLQLLSCKCLGVAVFQR